MTIPNDRQHSRCIKEKFKVIGSTFLDIAGMTAGFSLGVRVKEESSRERITRDKQHEEPIPKQSATEHIPGSGT